MFEVMLLYFQNVFHTIVGLSMSNLQHIYKCHGDSTNVGTEAYTRVLVSLTLVSQRICNCKLTVMLSVIS